MLTVQVQLKLSLFVGLLLVTKLRVRNGGTEVGKAITLSESMTEGILAMDKTKV